MVQMFCQERKKHPHQQQLHLIILNTSKLVLAYLLIIIFQNSFLGILSLCDSFCKRTITPPSLHKNLGKVCLAKLGEGKN